MKNQVAIIVVGAVVILLAAFLVGGRYGRLNNSTIYDRLTGTVFTCNTGGCRALPDEP